MYLTLRKLKLKELQKVALAFVTQLLRFPRHPGGPEL
jgi:hypothetical protein